MQLGIWPDASLLHPTTSSHAPQAFETLIRQQSELARRNEETMAAMRAVMATRERERSAETLVAASELCEMCGSKPSGWCGNLA